jgi:hypothetical protein
MGVGPIPVNVIWQYMDEIGMLDIDDREDMRRQVQGLDFAYLAHLRERHEREQERKGKKPPPEPPKGQR